MKKIKYIIFSLIVIIFTSAVLIINANITEIANEVLKEIVNVNIKIDKVKLRGLHVDVENITINELDGTRIGNIKRAKLKLMPLLITRLNYIDLYGGDFLVHQKKSGELNINNILRKKDDIDKIDKPNKVSSINKVRLHNIDVTYINDTYEARIEKKVYKANGEIDLRKTVNYEINAKGVVLDENKKENGVFSINIKKDYIAMNLSNVYATKEFMQFVPVDFVSVDKAYLDGDIIIADKDVSVDLKANATGVWYKGYEQKLNDVNLDVSFKDKNLVLSADTKLNGSDIDLKVNLTDSNILNLKADVKNISFDDIKKYELIKKANLDINTKIDLDADVTLNLREKGQVKLEEYIINAEAKEIEYNKIKLQDTIVKLDSRKKDNTYLKTSIKNEIKRKLDLNVELLGEFNILTLNGDLRAKLDVKDELKELKNIDTEVKFKNEKDKYVLDVSAKKDDTILSIDGSTSKKDLVHNYKVKYKDSIYNLDTTINGTKDNVNADLDINVKKFNESIVYLYDVNLKAKATNILSNDRVVKSSGLIKDVWVQYQRLQNITFDLNLENNIVKAENIKNQNLDMYLNYDINNGTIDSDISLKNYMVYSTSKMLDVNLLLNRLNVNVSGTRFKPIVTGDLKSSKLVMNKQYIGDVVLDINTVDTKYKINSSVENSKVNLSYDIFTKKIEANLDIDQKIENIANLNGLNASIISKANLQGSLHDIFGKLNFNFKNLEYKGTKLPEILVKMDAKNLDVAADKKKGIIDVSDISLISKENKLIYNTSMKLDLENIEIDLDVRNKIIDLSKISDDLKGKVELNGYLKGKNNDYYGELSLVSENFVISNNKFDNLIFSVQLDNNGFSIGQGYLEYEKNPLILEGYMLFNPLTYNMKIVADNFNLAFLKLNKSVKNAKGIANINLILNDGNFVGNIKLDDFLLKTRDLDISKTNIDIEMLNRDIKVNRFVSNINKGKLKIEGNLKVPNIDKETIKKKKVDLDNFELTLDAKKIELRNKSNKLVINSDLKLNSKKLLGKIDILGGEISDLSFIPSKKKKNVNYVSFINEMVYNTIKGYYAEVNLNIKDSVSIDIPSYLILQRIKGKLYGSADVYYYNSKPKIDGKFYVDEGTYSFNYNEFDIDSLIVRFDENSVKINPHIDLRSHTKLDNDRVQIDINSNLDNIYIDIKSASNKSREEIINQLTLNTENLNLSKDILNFATNTAINQIINKFTAPLGKKLGLSRFEINATTDNEKFLSLDGIKNTVADVYLQAKLYKDFYLDFRTRIPFDIKDKASIYDIGLSYDIKGNVNAILGIKVDTNYKNNTNVNFYTGLSYTEEFNYFSDLFKKKKK